MAILDGTEVSLDDLISCSKLHSLLISVIDKLNEQGAAIKQLREQDVSPAMFCKTLALDVQMCAENGSDEVKLEERLSVLEDVTTRLPKAQAELADVEARMQGLARELSCTELQVEQMVASLEKKMEEQVECNIASLERKMETQIASLEEKLDAQAKQYAANAEKLVAQRFESMEQRARQEQAQVDPHVKECSAYVGTEIDMAAPEAAKTSMEPTNPVGLLFPGQGSQFVTMLSSVQDLPAVKEMLEKAKAILGWDVLQLCITGPESKLQDSRFCQPVMFIAGLAAMERLRQDRREAAERFQVTAGLGVGEYAALCAAGVFSFEDGLKLADIRGKAAHESHEALGRRRPAALWTDGLAKPRLEELCKKAEMKEGSSALCQIVSELHQHGFCCGGTEAAIYFLKFMAEKAGALDVRILKGFGFSNTALMATEKVGKALDEMLPRMNPPRHSVYMNATAQPIRPGTNPNDVVELLKRQLTSPEKWEPSMRAIIKSGVTEFYVMGRSFIKDWVRRTDPKVWETTTNVAV